MGPPAGRGGGPSPVGLLSLGGATRIAVPFSASGCGCVPSRAMPRLIAARLWARAWRPHRRPDHWVLCYAGTNRSGWPHPGLWRRRLVLCLPRGTGRGRPRHCRGWRRYYLPARARLPRGRLRASRRGATPPACPPIQWPRGWRPASGPWRCWSQGLPRRPLPVRSSPGRRRAAWPSSLHPWQGRPLRTRTACTPGCPRPRAVPPKPGEPALPCRWVSAMVWSRRSWSRLSRLF